MAPISTCALTAVKRSETEQRIHILWLYLLLYTRRIVLPLICVSCLPCCKNNNAFMQHGTVATCCYRTHSRSSRITVVAGNGQWEEHLAGGVAAQRDAHELAQLREKRSRAVQHVQVAAPVATLAQVPLGGGVQGEEDWVEVLEVVQGNLAERGKSFGTRPHVFLVHLCVQPPDQGDMSFSTVQSHVQHRSRRIQLGQRHTSSAMMGTPNVPQSFTIFLCTLQKLIIAGNSCPLESPCTWELLLHDILQAT